MPPQARAVVAKDLATESTVVASAQQGEWSAACGARFALLVGHPVAPLQQQRVGAAAAAALGAHLSESTKGKRFIYS